MSLTYSTSSVASFEDVKKFGNQPSKDVYIIDVREPSELQETGVIPSSINIPLGELETALKDLTDNQFRDKFGREKPDKQSLIIYSCLKGGRSAKAQELSQQLGYEKYVYFMNLLSKFEESSVDTRFLIQYLILVLPCILQAILTHFGIK
nr:unnamed protein product [Callosobruchus analis]